MSNKFAVSNVFNVDWFARDVQTYSRQNNALANWFVFCLLCSLSLARSLALALFSWFSVFCFKNIWMCERNGFVDMAWRCGCDKDRNDTEPCIIYKCCIEPWIAHSKKQSALCKLMCVYAYAKYTSICAWVRRILYGKIFFFARFYWVRV